MRAETLKVISVLDPAVDHAAMTEAEMVDYIKTRDIAKLKIKPGQNPTVFTVRAVPHDLWESYVMAVEGDAERALRCFRVGVRKVENLYQDDGVSLENYEVGEDVMPAAKLERFAPSERHEIGKVVWDHSFLPRRIAPTYQLPLSSASILTSRDFRPAGASPNSPATSSDPQSSPSGSAPPQQPATGSDSSASASP